MRTEAKAEAKLSELDRQIKVWESTREEWLYLYRNCPPIQETRYHSLILQSEAVIATLKSAQITCEMAFNAAFPLTREG